MLENRCVSDCGNEYEFGDFFYNDCIENKLITGIDKLLVIKIKNI